MADTTEPSTTTVVTDLTQQEAHDYLQDLRIALLFPGTDFDSYGKGFEDDRQKYLDKIEEVKAYLATFPVPLN